MKVLVSDSSILIEFSKRELLDKMFDLELQFAVPDLLFHEELIDLGSYSRRDLVGFGLRVEALDAEGVELAIAYQSERPALSLVDAFALALADRQGWASPDGRQDHAYRRRIQWHRTLGRTVDSRQNAGVQHSIGVSGRGCA